MKVEVHWGRCRGISAYRLRANDVAGVLKALQLRAEWGHFEGYFTTKAGKVFDDAGVPCVALTMAGHDHNVSIYGPRPRDNSSSGAVELSLGIHILVNGARGRGHDTGFRGTRPDLFLDDDNYSLTTISVLDDDIAHIEILGFGRMKHLQRRCGTSCFAGVANSPLKCHASGASSR